jgi:hypothetical protein
MPELGRKFTKVREIAVSGFAADDSPNDTAPDAADVFDADAEARAFSAEAVGHWMFIRFVEDDDSEEAAATASFTTWRADGNGKFAALESEADAPSSGLYRSKSAGQLFVQVTAIDNVGAATKLQVWMAEQAER